MNIEQLPGTSLFDCYRVSLAALKEFHTRREPLTPPDPQTAFLKPRYRLSASKAFKAEILPYLQPRPIVFEGDWLFVYVLTAATELLGDMFNSITQRNPIDWFLPPDLAEWQDNGNVSSFIPKDGRGIRCLIKGEDSNLRHASFCVDRSFRHDIWEFGLPPEDEVCYKGQVIITMGA